MGSTLYSERFQTSDAAEEYEMIEYSSGSYSSYIWQLQRPILLDWLLNYKQEHSASDHLDFACGTGRILSFVETHVTSSLGVDISADMADIARQKCKVAKIEVGDILADSSVADGDYDIVTCFRFLLNTSPDMREKVLVELRKRLSQKNGMLITNVHGSKNSLRYWSLLYRRVMHNERHAEMSYAEIEALLNESGFEIVECVGFGLVPPTLYRTPLAPLAKAIDKLGSQLPFLTRYSIDLMFRCRLS